MVLILGNDPNRRTRLGGILWARHGPNRTTLDRPSAILRSAHFNTVPFSLPAPTYVQVERTPPNMSRIVAFRSPRYGNSTVLPSEAR